MAVRAVREFDGKQILYRWLRENSDFKFDLDGLVSINPSTVFEKLPEKYPWLLTKKLVAKPDQLIKRRGKLGLLCLNATFEQAAKWIEERRGKELTVERVTGVLDHFIIEPFCPHTAADEYYLCIRATRETDEILFHHEGGVDVGDVDAKAVRLEVPVDGETSEQEITEKLLQKVPEARRPVLASFIHKLLAAFRFLHFSYLEINPLVVTGDNNLTVLDLAAKLDETARFEVGKHWGKIEFPPAFGRKASPEEAFIAQLDSQTGASLKLTILNPKGRIWCMVAGGGASVIYADTLTDLGAGSEIANYGEYSGAPTEAQTFEYACTILKLMTQEPHPQGKILLIGGGIANFTNVAETFKGIIRALTKYADLIRSQNIKIYVRRGGPNYQEGLERMRELAENLNLHIEVYGPETHMTAICAMALGKETKEYEPKYVPVPPAQGRYKSLLPNAGIESITPGRKQQPGQGSGTGTPTMSPSSSMTNIAAALDSKTAASGEAKVPQMVPATPAFSQTSGDFQLFTPNTRALIIGMQPGAVQHMLDFDFICGRQKPSVAGMVYPFTANHLQKFYWNTQEILIPIYQHLDEAIAKNPDVDVIINFSSCRAVYETSLEILKHPQIKTMVIIAEGVPERRTRLLNKMARQKGVTIIGPATVGGIKPGCFRLGNTGGMLDNIIASRLYRPGSVAYVARSGGMSNELSNIIARNSDGVYEGISIGGDRYPGSTFIDHLLRFEANPDVKMMVVLGEVGGTAEYEIVKAVEEKRLTKPIVAWCVGTCAKIFPYEVQFGHAGACAQGQGESADDKNKAMKAAGIIVPDSFDDIGICINQVYSKLVENGTIKLRPEMPVPTIPVDYDWARKLGLIRKPSHFVSSIVDDRGEELVYAGMKISDVFKSNLGVGGVVGLIWFRKALPDYFCRFIEMVLMVTADHGPAVSGAHNTIVCARAGKDLISSLVSGLLTIGPRFGGALDEAAVKFSWAYDRGMSAEDFVTYMRNNKELIPGIGHKVKSLENPDVRVTIVKNFVKKHFKSSEVFDFACEVEKVTTKKKSNLILNVDGAIACAFVDLLRSCGAFTVEEAKEYIEMGVLNGLFVLGRSIGFIGHWIDQKRLKQGLYRHPTEDISYLVGHSLAV